MSDYNYSSFPLDMHGADFARFPELARAGATAPDGELTDARAGRKIRLSELWSGAVTVLEFGSVT
jgi:hypothetical protein